MIYYIDFSPGANRNMQPYMGSSFLPILSTSVHLREWKWQPWQFSWALRDWWVKVRIQCSVSHNKIDDECEVNSQHDQQAWANKCAPHFVGIEGQYKVSVDEHQKNRDDPTNHLKKRTKQVTIVNEWLAVLLFLWGCTIVYPPPPVQKHVYSDFFAHLSTISSSDK